MLNSTTHLWTAVVHFNLGAASCLLLLFLERLHVKIWGRLLSKDVDRVCHFQVQLWLLSIILKLVFSVIHFCELLVGIVLIVVLRYLACVTIRLWLWIWNWDFPVWTEVLDEFDHSVDCNSHEDSGDD